MRNLKFLMPLAMLLCSFSLLLSSCDKEIAGTDSGDPVVVSFSVSGNLFGANEEITRSSETIAPETVVIPVEGGWYMYATLEPDTKTRATSGGTDPLATGTEVRILAYLNGGTTLAASADYVVSGSSLNPKTSPLTVTPGNYSFVAYAINGSTLPGSPTNIDPSATDLRWGETNILSIPAQAPVNITIGHLCSKVTAVIKTIRIMK